MATITPTIEWLAIGKGDGSVYRVTWKTIGDADTCTPYSCPEYTDKSIQVEGTFSSASVAIQGSNDGTNFEPLRDPSGTTIAITAAGIKQVLENTLLVRPASTGGASSSLTVTVLMRLNNPLRQ